MTSGLRELVQQDMQAGMTASDVVSRRLIVTMEVVGQKFQAAQIFVPEMMIAARSMSVILAKLKNQLVEKSGETKGSICIGYGPGRPARHRKEPHRHHAGGQRVSCNGCGGGGFHGKVHPGRKSQKPGILAMSSLLTTTMGEMKHVLKALQDEGAQRHAEGHYRRCPGDPGLCRPDRRRRLCRGCAGCRDALQRDPESHRNNRGEPFPEVFNILIQEDYSQGGFR